MKRGIIVIMFITFSIIAISSCKSRHPKCPGVYSNNNQTEKVEKPI